jgi:DNA polymerase III epsilon subunit-like protein
MKHFKESYLPKIDDLTGLSKGLIIDTEATGLDPHTSDILELAIREFFYCPKTKKILSAGNSYSWLHQPKTILSERITELTGITNDMVYGKSIDWDIVNTIVDSADVIIAHNSKFDYDQISSYLIVPPIHCSLSLIDWDSRVLCDEIKRDQVSLCHNIGGFLYKAHRALNDANALLLLLVTTDTLHELLSPRITLSLKGYIPDNFFKDYLQPRRFKINHQTNVVSKEYPKTTNLDLIKRDILSNSFNYDPRIALEFSHEK